MGCKFCKKKGYQKINYLAPDEKEIEIKDYSSKNDNILEILETKYNILNYVQLVEYVNLLDQFNLETLTIITDEPMKIIFRYDDEFLTKSLSKEEFKNFIEKKIYLLEIINEIISNNQEIMPIFLNMCLVIYDNLEFALNQKYEDKSSINIIKKSNLLAIGMLYCSCENIEKIKLFFDIFKNEKEEFYKSDKLDNYLLTLFLTSSYCLVKARENISNQNKEINSLSKEDLTTLLNIYQVKKCENLVTTFNEVFFRGQNFKWEIFKNKFEDKENGFGWLLTSKGIRRKLEENVL